MTEDEARARLARMVATAIAPGLTDDDVDLLVTIAKRPDSQGRTPSDAAWSPTWNLDVAAATGWEWKAARCSGDYRFASDGQSFNREQVYEHCLKMVEHYSRGRATTRVAAIADDLIQQVPDGPVEESS